MTANRNKAPNYTIIFMLMVPKVGLDFGHRQAELATARWPSARKRLPPKAARIPAANNAPPERFLYAALNPSI